MVTKPGRGWLGWIAAIFVCLSGSAVWAQDGADGAIGGRVLSVAGAPLAGAVVAVRELETGLVLRARSGARGEFLIVRLPVGEYAVTVNAAGAVMTLPAPVEVGLGEVMEVEARLEAPAARPQPNDSAESGTALTGADVAALPFGGGDWRSLALTVAGANAAAGSDDDADEVSFRGVAVTQNSARIDGASGDNGFTGSHTGAGVEEDVDAGRMRSRTGQRAWAAGLVRLSMEASARGRRMGFSQAAVRGVSGCGAGTSRDVRLGAVRTRRRRCGDDGVAIGRIDAAWHGLFTRCGAARGLRRIRSLWLRPT